MYSYCRRLERQGGKAGFPQKISMTPSGRLLQYDMVDSSIGDGAAQSGVWR